MKWLEVIELRTARESSKELKEKLLYLIEEINKKNNLTSVKVYAHVNVETDFNIQIIHDSGNVEESGSKLGLQIALNFKQYGLVNHNVWLRLDKS